MDPDREIGFVEEQGSSKAQNGRIMEYLRSITYTTVENFLLFFSLSHQKQLPPLRAMENPADYDIDKDTGEDEVRDETRIGKTQWIEKLIIIIIKKKTIRSINNR